MILRFFAALSPCTKGLLPIMAVPSASPAVLRRKSRLLRPRCQASSSRAGIVLPNDDEAVNSNPPYDHFGSLSCANLFHSSPTHSKFPCHRRTAALKAWWQIRTSPNIQTAGPQPFPYQLRPFAAPRAADRPRTPAVHDPFARREHNTGRDGNERLEDWDLVPVPVGTPEMTWQTHAGRRRECLAASVRRQVFHPMLSTFAAGTPPFENSHWILQAAFPSTNLPRNNTGPERCQAVTLSNVGTSELRRLPGSEN